MNLKLAAVAAACVATFLATTSFADEGNPLLDAYVKVSRALASDDLAGAQKAGTDLAGAAKSNESVAKNASELSKSDSLEKARAHFKLLSVEVTTLAEGKDGYYVMTCPMVKADWVQPTKEVSNPYMGGKMSTCGSIKSEQKTSDSRPMGCCPMTG